MRTRLIKPHEGLVDYFYSAFEVGLAGWSLMSLQKIVSGGQTGVDRGALRAAKGKIETGGWAPPNYMTTTGPNKLLGSVYGLIPIDTIDPSSTRSIADGYIARSKKNVDDSDGTLCFREKASHGTDLTIQYAMGKKWTNGKWQNLKQPHYRPCYVARTFDLKEIPGIVKWVEKHKIKVLNVAGSRIPTYTEPTEKVISALILTSQAKDLNIPHGAAIQNDTPDK